MRDDIKSFLNSLHGKAPKTRETYHKVLNAFFSGIEYTGDVKNLTIDDVSNYLKDLTEEGRTTSTISTYSICLRLFFNHHDRGDLSKKIKVKRPRKTKKKNYVKYEWWDDLFEAAGSDRDRAIIASMLATGMRVGEARRMKVGDIDWDRKLPRIHVPHAKGDRDVYYYGILPYFRKYVKPWVAGRQRGYVFVGGTKEGCIEESTIRKMVKLVAMRAQVPDYGTITPHSLRHSIAVWANWEQNWSDQQIQQILHHEEVKTTFIYTEADDDQIEKFLEDNLS